MALDTFAKRLGSQLRPSPGDISVDDRWAVGGTFKPTIAQGGRVFVALGALTAAFAGTVTTPDPADLNFSDRVRLEGRPFPGDLGIENRYAIGGSFRHFVAADNSGLISTTLGALTASVRGTVTAPAPSIYAIDDRYHIEGRPYPGAGIGLENRFAIGGTFLHFTGTLPTDGKISTTLGALTASLRGEHYYDLFFDVDYSVTPAFTFTDVQSSQGLISTTLGALTASLRGTALPPNSTAGLIQTLLSPIAASLRGTMAAPAGRDGRLHIDLSALQAQLKGSAVPPLGNSGGISSALGGVTASLRGTFTKFSTDGLVNVSLGALTANFNGQFIDAGTIIGLINAQLGGLVASFQGTSFVLVGDLYADGLRVVPVFDATVQVEPALDATVTVIPLT